jgi:hypothetical protein
MKVSCYLRRMHRWAACLLCACGRIGFATSSDDDARTDAIGAGSSDATDASDLGLHVTFDHGRPIDELGHTASCSTCPTSGTGRVGINSGVFDGTRCLEIADAPDLRPPSFTVALWVNVGDLTTDMTFFSKELNGQTMNLNTFELYQLGPFQEWCALVGVQFSCFTTTTAGTWHHLATTYDATAGLASFYVDGVLFEANNVAAPLYANDPIHVGCEVNFGATEGFAIGMLDDVRLYKRALQANEIAALTSL